MHEYDCGVSFSFDCRELVQDVTVRLQNLRWRVFMFDAEGQEGGALWEWLQTKYLSCGRLAVFVNERYLQRPVTRRELQFFHEHSEKWAGGSINLFVDRRVSANPLLFPLGFTKHELSDGSTIASIIART